MNLTIWCEHCGEYMVQTEQCCECGLEVCRKCRIKVEGNFYCLNSHPEPEKSQCES